MHIQHLEIDNFKSFHGKTVIPFRRGFTTVSGPNGSGKSNIVDGILFCLGLSTSRTMRAEKLTDLINNTSRRREAQVTITFNKGNQELPEALLEQSFSENDEEKAKALALLENLKSGDTLRVSRRIKASANNYTSTYYMNEKPSTLGEIHEVLALYNVSPGCYNVMMQGDVAAIVNMSGMERRRIIDELAGVADYDRKIEQASREISTAGETIDRNELLLSEINTRLSELEGEKEKALAYKALRERVQALEVQAEVAKLKSLALEVKNKESQLENARETRLNAQAQLKEHALVLKALNTELQALADEIKTQGEARYMELHAEMEHLNTQKARKDEMIRGLEARTTDANTQHEKLERDKEQILAWLENAQADMGIFDTQVNELEGLHDTQKKRVDVANQQLDALSTQDAEVLEQRQALRQQLETVEDALSTVRREQLDLEAESVRLGEDNSRHEQGLLSFKTREHALQKRRNTIQQEANVMVEQKAALEAWLHTATGDMALLNSNLKRVNHALFQSKEALATQEARRSAYEEVNHSRSIKTILEANLPGVHGTLAMLATCHDDYELALETALGARMQHVIVEDDDVARKGIQLLQDKRAGRATFLPMNRIKPSFAKTDTLPSGNGIIDFAINLLEFDTEFETIYRFALADTLIIETMNAAKPLMNRFRMITLDGALFEKSGAMTGGSVFQNRSRQGGFGAGVKDSQLDVEIANLRHDVARLEDDKRQSEQRLVKLEAQVQPKQRELSELIPLLSRYEAELDAMARQLLELQAETAAVEDVRVHGDSKATMTQRLEELNRLEETLQKKQQQAEAKRTKLQQQLDVLDATLSQQEIQTLKEELNEAQFQREAYDAQLRDVQGQRLARQREMDIRAGLIEGKTTEQDAIVQQQHTWRLEIETLNGNIVELSGQYHELQQEMDSLGQGVKELKAKQDDAQKRLLSGEKEKLQLERQLQESDERIIHIQAQLRELQPQLEQLMHTLSARIPNLEEQLSATDSPTEADSIQEVQRLQRKMANLEPVNMKAIDEHASVSKREEELRTKVNTLANERETLNAKIAEYEAMKRLYFMKAFDSVNTQFQHIYAELSDGYGQLVLTDAENPFNGGLTIEASPRGKKTQRIEAMSGGEKSLTSLAFVFALQRTQPAPFYALDEVDQNLDGINVEKLSNMIVREAQAAQFVVVSLRKPMIENSDRTVGVTQRRNGISKVTGIQHRPEIMEASPLLHEEETVEGITGEKRVGVTAPSLKQNAPTAPASAKAPIVLANQ
jgi:chromosome segregation protein